MGGPGEPSSVRVTRRTRRSRSEIPVPGPEADMEFVGRIPRVALRPDKRVLSFYEPQNHVCEEYRLLGKNLLHTLAATAGDPKLGKIVTLSSSSRGEGKTLTCVNLANTLSQDLKNRVLLIDADLRHPRVSRYLGLPASHGLNDLLATDNPAAILEDCLLRTDTGLHLLASAPRDHASGVGLWGLLGRSFLRLCRLSAGAGRPGRAGPTAAACSRGLLRPKAPGASFGHGSDPRAQRGAPDRR